MRRVVVIFILMLLALPTAGFAQQSRRGEPSAAQLQRYDTKYYVIQTDLTGDDVREAALRMTKMAEEYHERTRDFSGVISTRLPFMLFRNKEDYYAAGGLAGSAGIFDGHKLMAIAGDKLTPMTWHVIQHEGFHQFAHTVIRGDLPVWVNEGMAEYFGEGLWTGDGFVTGLIPPSRLKRVKESMEHGRFFSIDKMMQMGHDEWNGRLQITNYDQAWSMVHFLAHGDNGKYQSAFSGYMHDIGRGRPAANAWHDNFGDTNGFQERWTDYWMNLPDQPTKNLYIRAAAASLTSFLARAELSKQTFASFEDFKAAIKDNSLKINQADWLPHELATDMLGLADRSGAKWSIVPAANKQSTLLVELDDGSRLVGTYTGRGGRIDHVQVDLDDLKPKLAQAADLLAAGHRDQARTLVQDALKQNPKSPYADDARKFLTQNK